MTNLETMKSRPIASLAIAAQAYVAIETAHVWLWPDSLVADDVPKFAAMATINCIVVIMLLAGDIFGRK